MRAQFSRLWTQNHAAWIWSSATSWAPWTSYLSWSQFPHLWNGGYISTNIQGLLWRLRENLQCTIWCRVIIDISCHLIFSVFFKDFLVHALHTVICSSWILFGCPAWGKITFSHIVSPFPSLLSLLWKIASHLFTSHMVLCHCCVVFWPFPAPKQQILLYCDCIPLLHLIAYILSTFIFYFFHLLLFTPSDEPRIYFVNK